MAEALINGMSATVLVHPILTASGGGGGADPYPQYLLRTDYTEGDPDVPLETRLDDAGNGVSYIGKAAPGSSPGNPVWQIIRLTETDGDLVTEYADGDANFDNVWDARTGLSY